MSKKILSLTLLVSTALCASLCEASPAANDAANGIRIISDPLYLPLAGQLYGVSGYTNSQGGYHSYNYAGVEHLNVNSNGNAFAQNLSYGVTDQLTLRFSDSYASSTSDADNDLSGAASSTRVSGLADPTLGIGYRAIDQMNGAPVSLDFNASYSPDLINDKVASVDHDGTEGAGRQTTGASIALGRVMSNVTVEGAVGASYLGKRNFEYQSNGQHGDANAYWTSYLYGATQVRLTNRLSANGSYRWTAENNTAGRNEDSGLSWTTDNPDVGDLSVSLNYHFIVNKIVGQLSYDNVQYTRSSSQYSVPTDNTEIRNQHNNVVGARLLYVF